MQESPPISEKNWFYEENGQRQGGLDEQAIIALIHSGKLSYGSAVWRKGLSDWTRLEDTELRPHLERLSPPPLAGRQVNNSLVWVLAFAPLIGYLLEWIVAFAVHDSEYRAEQAMAETSYWYVTPLLNILLSFLDEKRLQRAGHDTRRFKGWVWLVPVYLYQRAQALGQNLAYFAVWIACFALVLFA